jgi:hypothetical protein
VSELGLPVGPCLRRGATYEPAGQNYYACPGQSGVKGRVGQVIKSCFVELSTNLAPGWQPEVPGFALQRELVSHPGCRITAASVPVRRLQSLGDEVLPELETTVQEVGVVKAPCAEERQSGASNSRSVTVSRKAATTSRSIELLPLGRQCCVESSSLLR